MADIQVYKRTPERDAILTAVPRRSHVPTKQTVQNVSTRREEEPADDEYKGMFKLVLEAEGEERDDEGNITKEGTYYLSVINNGKWAWGDMYCGRVHHLYGDTGGGYVLCPARRKVVADTDVYLDFFSLEIVFVERGDVVFSQWVFIGSYFSYKHTIAQVAFGDAYVEWEGYEGAFNIEASPKGVVVCQGVCSIPYTANFNTCGYASVNNIGYSVNYFYGEVPKTTTYYFLRHTVRATSAGEDENDNLTEARKNELRNIINSCDEYIKTEREIIKNIGTNIDSAKKLRTGMYTTKSSIASKYNNMRANCNKTYSAECDRVNEAIESTKKEIAALNPENSNYFSDLKEYNKKIEYYESELVDLSKKYSYDILSIDNDCAKELSEQDKKISDLDSSINKCITEISEHEYNIVTKINTRNVACLELYGVAEQNSSCEIVALPSTANTSQTDQYIYFYIGKISILSGKVVVQQSYLGGGVQLYRISSVCRGLEQ